jgi:hypothetical protein
MLQNTVAISSYALKSYADYKAQILEINCRIIVKDRRNEVWVKL